MYIPINGLELTHLMRFCKILIQGVSEQTRRYFSLWKAKFMSLKIKHSFVKKLFISSNFKLKWFYVLHYYISIHVSVLCVDCFCLHKYICAIYEYLVLMDNRRKQLILLHWSYRWLWGATWVLGTEPKISEIAKIFCLFVCFYFNLLLLVGNLTCKGT